MILSKNDLYPGELPLFLLLHFFYVVQQFQVVICNVLFYFVGILGVLKLHHFVWHTCSPFKWSNFIFEKTTFYFDRFGRQDDKNVESRNMPENFHRTFWLRQRPYCVISCWVFVFLQWLVIVFCVTTFHQMNLKSLDSRFQSALTTVYQCYGDSWHKTDTEKVENSPVVKIEAIGWNLNFQVWVLSKESFHCISHIISNCYSKSWLDNEVKFASL